MSQNFKLSMTAEEINQSLESMHALLNEVSAGLYVKWFSPGQLGTDDEAYVIYNIDEQLNLDPSNFVGISVDPETKIPKEVITPNRTLPIFWVGEN